MVPVVAGERLRGQWNWVCDTCPEIRSLLFGLTASLAVVGRVGSNNRNFGLRRAQKLRMAEAAYSVDQATAWQWPEWEIQQFFPLSHQAELELLEMVRVIPHVNTSAWFPRRSPVSLDRMAFIKSDSAGLSGKDALAARGAAAWLYSTSLDKIPYIIEDWRQDVLESTHSTQQESANATANLSHWGECPELGHIEVFVEILDSASSVYNLRRMAARRPGLERVLEERVRVIRGLARRGVRVLTLWDARARNDIADRLSKYDVEGARDELLQRAPNKPMSGEQTVRPPNVLNVSPSGTTVSRVRVSFSDEVRYAP